MDRPTARTFPIRRPDPLSTPAELDEFRGDPPRRIRFPDGGEPRVPGHADLWAAPSGSRIGADAGLPGFSQTLPGAEPGGSPLAEVIRTGSSTTASAAHRPLPAGAGGVSHPYVLEAEQ